MFCVSQIPCVALSDQQLAVCRAHACAANIGGRSSIYGDGSNRKRQEEHQLVGQCCEAACMLYFGYPFFVYDERRKKLNKNPTKGDGGFDFKDLSGRTVDAKGSMCHADAEAMLSYHLYVRKKERTANRYVLCLICKYNFQQVFLVGWFPDAMLAGMQGKEPGRFDVKAQLLYPMHMYYIF